MEELDLLALSTLTVDKEYIEFGEFFTPRIILRNRSDKDVFNIVIKGCIPKGSKFEGNVVKLNGMEDRGNHPALGINIVKLEKGKDIEVTFNLKCILSDGGYIKNDFKVEYQYYDYALEEYRTLEKNIEAPSIKVNEANFKNNRLEFKSDATFPDVNEEININLKFYNSGNASANNTLVSINLPKEIKRSTEEVFVNGEKFLLDKGLKEIKIGKVNPFDEVTIDFKCEGIERSEKEGAIVNGKILYETFLTPDESRKKTFYLNDIKFNISSPEIVIKNKISNLNPIVDDIVNVNFFINNVGNKAALNGRLFLDFPSFMSLEERKVYINGIERDGEEILKGISLGNINEASGILVDLKLKCLEKGLDDISGINGKIAYEYKSDDINGLKYKESFIAPILIKISNAECVLRISCNKDRVVLDDVVTFNITVENIGTLELLNVFLKSTENKELEFIKESLVIDGKEFELGNITKGVCLGNIDIQNKIEINLKAKVTSIGSSGKLCFDVFGEFQYRNNNLAIQKKLIEEKSIVIESGVALFKSLNVDSTLNIPRHMPGIKEILDLESKVLITEYYPINIKNNSLNGSNGVSGKKLVINGRIESKLEYISIEAGESTYLTTNSTIFSTFIILPKDFELGNGINLVAMAKDEYTRILNLKSIYILSTINVEGRIIN